MSKTSKGGSIRLHKEHGLNPTMSVCLLCQEETGEIALLGASYKGEAPMKMVTSIEPCKKCKKKYLSVGVLLVEVKLGFDDRGKAMKEPTGNVTVLKDKAFEQVFSQKPPAGKIAMVEEGVIQKLVAGAKENSK